jgi:hypothetical protein
MALLARLFDFTPSTPILSGDVDSEFNQLVNMLNGSTTNKHALIKHSHGSDAPLILDQLSTGPIQEWRAAAVQQQKMKANGFLLGVPRCVNVDGTVTGNVGGGLDNLNGFNLPANSLAANGDYVRARYGGTFGTNDADKRIVILFGGQTVHDTTGFDQDTGSWSYDIVYTRTSATSVVFSLLAAWNAVTVTGAQAVGGNGLVIGTSTTLTVANLVSNDTVMQVQAEGTSNNDIVQLLQIIELTQNT